MADSISSRTIVVVAKEQSASALGDETTILQMRSGVYYGLDAIGTRIWSLLQQPRSVSEIRATLLEEYEVEPDQCGSDLLVLLEKLRNEGLIEIHDSAAA